MKFEKVKLNEYKKIRKNQYINGEYEEIKLPKRSTKLSAGYDFFSPYDVVIDPSSTVIIPSGVKCQLDDDKVLMLYIRSSLGIKKGLMLSNTTGIIDADYYNNESNEGHILIALNNTSKEQVQILKGEHFVQGVIMRYYLVDDDNQAQVRKGGIGSTN